MCNCIILEQIPEEIHELPSVLRSINQLSTASNLRRSASGLSSTDTCISADRYLKESAHPSGSAVTPMFNQRESKLSTISAPQGLGSPCGFECRPIQLEGHFANPRNVAYSGLPRRNVSSHPSLLRLDTSSESKSPVKFDNASETAEEEEEVGVGEVGAGTDSECERLDEKLCAYSTRDQQFFGDDFQCNGAAASGITSNLSKPYTDAELGSINEAVSDCRVLYLKIFYDDISGNLHTLMSEPLAAPFFEQPPTKLHKKSYERFTFH
ncbi:unnamed protein product [Dibothriocephalus latus]|uniref:Uncharacterized protein n=1 Tax=Dibothriocephalus latus TaxID=60516 RepID=A0A3P6PD39_DIBLA|nr:unnamed protein product [Dibothriocephalus latus]